MYDTINQYVRRCARFSEEELALFNSLLQSRFVPKKTFLLQEGDICQFEAYLDKGCIKSYFLNENGFEVILTFATEDWWVSDIASFHEQIPSRMYIETLEDCELLVLSPAAKEELLAKAPRFERVFRLMVQRHLASYQERLFGNIAKSAQERYLDFLQKYPTLPLRVPQHQIAAYLGISPEFLSKIRARLSHK